MTRKQQPSILLALLASCFVVIRYVQLSFTIDALQKGIVPSFADLVIQSISGEGQISCSWFLGVGVVCAALAVMWERERNPQLIVVAGSWRRLCAGELRDAAFVALGVGAVEFALICCSAAVGAAVSGLPFSSFASRGSYLEFRMGFSLAFEPNPVLFVGICLASLLTVCLFGAALFLLLRWASGTNAVPFAVVLALGLTAVQGEYSFMYEAVRALGGTLTLANPLYLLERLPSVTWDKWAQTDFSGIGAMAVLAVLLCVLAFVVAPYTRRADLVPSVRRLSPSRRSAKI